MHRRIVNNRPICFCAIALFLGLSVTAACLDSVAGRVFALAAAVIVTGLLFIFNKIRYVYIPLAFAAGIFLLSGVYGAYISKPIDVASENITATIASEIVESDEGYFYFDVENIAVDGEKLKHGATVYCWSLPDSRAGDEVVINGKIVSRTFEMSGGFTARYHDGNYYKISAYDLEGLGEGTLKLPTKINVTMKRALYNNVDEDTTDIITALLFGDKYGIGAELYDNVKDAGLAHIFAVSGLHVGILAGAIYLLAKKLKLRGYARLFTVLFFLLLYGGLCGFPASVVRAIIMSSVFMLADCTGRQKDHLTSLAFAAIICMVFTPMDFSSLGFRMSFVAVLGLILLKQPIEKRVLKRLPKGVKEITAGSIAVNVMLFPIMAEAFGSVQTLFILANLIILPILPIIYIFSLIICLFVLIIPSAAPILISLTVVVWPIKLVSVLIGSLAISNIPAVGLGILEITYFAVIALLSRFVFLTRREKGVISLNLITVSVAVSALISLL